MYMPMTFVRRSAIPQPMKGKAATDPQITINENGQLVFSTLAMKIIGGKACTKVAIAYDPVKRTVAVFPQGHTKLPKDFPDKEFWGIKHSSKGNSAGLQGSGAFLNDTEHKVFAADEDRYNYKESGGQTFPVQEKEGTLVFTLPKGALQRRPKVERKKRSDSKKRVASIAGNGAPAPQTDAALELVESA
jgi:hypothetical protein